jgi:putative ABC transport system ATP-binding protein
MNDAVNVSEVTKAYRQGERTVEALRGVNLRVAPGEFLAIMGASGSGKSTLLHLCAALDRPDAGTIAIAGQDITTLSERQLTRFRRRQIGIVFQQFNLIPTLSARENVELPLELDGGLDAAHRARIDQLFDLLQIAHRAGHRPDALSGGEQQRVAIARAMATEPPVLFADEPTGNLDSNNADLFWDLLQQAARAYHTTIVMVTHEPAAALHADRVVVLRDGLISGEFAVEKSHDAGQLAARYQAVAR